MRNALGFEATEIHHLGEIKSGREILDATHTSHNYNKYIWHACESCGKERWVVIKRGKPSTLIGRCCSNKLHPRGAKGNANAQWKGGRITDGRGYIRIWLSPDDFFYPMATAQGYVYEHRLVVAKALNRCLLSWEVVHHKGTKYPLGSIENRSDNRYPENLELLKTNGQHNTQLDRLVKNLMKENKKLRARIQELEN